MSQKKAGSDSNGDAPAPERELPVTVFCGFLGAGKTTVLRRVLSAGAAPSDSGRRFGVLVNDLSDLAVDAEVLGEAREGTGEKIVNLHRGTLGGVLRREFREALETFRRDRETDYLLVETSGATHPGAMVEEILACPGIRLDTFVTVVDGLSLLRDYDGGRALWALENDAFSGAGALLLAQIRAASVVLLSKADRLTRAQAESMLAALQELNPYCTLITTAYGRVDVAHVVHTRSFRPQRFRLGTVTEDDPGQYNLGSDVLVDPRPFHPDRLYTLFNERLPFGIYRCKGWIWIASRPNDVFVFNQSGSQFGLEWVATWRATILESQSEKLMPEEVAYLHTFVDAGDPLFGDRKCELTVIGTRQDRTVFLRELEACLCTPAEVAAWQAGLPFADPWPKTVARV
jgi:G3E family GTPase